MLSMLAQLAPRFDSHPKSASTGCAANFVPLLSGLDSATTFLIIKCLSNFCHFLEGTLLVALLQPPPETYHLFDDVMLLSSGRLMYSGPRSEVRS